MFTVGSNNFKKEDLGDYVGKNKKYKSARNVKPTNKNVQGGKVSTPMKKALDVVPDLTKGGEGSRGGKIVGHTKSGKPVYESHHDSYKNFSRQDHLDASNVHKKLEDHHQKEMDKTDNKAFSLPKNADKKTIDKLFNQSMSHGEKRNDHRFQSQMHTTHVKAMDTNHHKAKEIMSAYNKGPQKGFEMVKKHGMTIQRARQIIKDHKANNKKIQKGIFSNVNLLKGKKMVVSTKEMVEEHEHLIDVLESKSHKDDKKEAKKQKKELAEYKEKLKGDKKMDNSKLAKAITEGLIKEFPELAKSENQEIDLAKGKKLDEKKEQRDLIEGLQHHLYRAKWKRNDVETHKKRSEELGDIKEAQKKHTEFAKKYAQKLGIPEKEVMDEINGVTDLIEAKVEKEEMFQPCWADKKLDK